jgi:hypothetical protein
MDTCRSPKTSVEKNVRLALAGLGLWHMMSIKLSAHQKKEIRCFACLQTLRQKTYTAYQFFVQRLHNTTSSSRENYWL